MNYFLEEFGITSTNEMTKEIAIKRAKYYSENKDNEVWDAWPLEDNCHYCITRLYKGSI